MQRKAMVTFSTSVLIFSFLIISLLQFSCSQKAYPSISCIARERRALLQFRNGLVDESNLLSSWSGEDCCNWKGVGCNKNTGHVVKLDLHNGFEGEINSSLLALKHLNYLDLSRSSFSGMPIPAFFGSFKNLKYLNLSGSQFMGNIPHNLGNLSHLQHLDLSRNFGDASLASESMSWVSKLSSLKSLDLSDVNLNGSHDWFRAINMLPSLMSLKLNYCHLYILPNPPHINLTSLTLLDLGANSFKSAIPSWLFNMTSLNYLDLSANYFHGLIPDKISQLTSLSFLDLSHGTESSRLISPLPNSLGSISSLHYLNLGFNDFGGSLPLGLLRNLTSLVVLNLQYNKFQGSIPREIGCLTQLIQLILPHNRLNGTISSNLWLLSNLELLDLSMNSLSGEISEVHFANLKKLKKLDISQNLFTLNVKSSWIPPFQLEHLGMDSLIIGPQFPSWLQNQRNLITLYLRNASISTDIPNWFENVHSRIVELDLSFNNITGKVPEFLDRRLPNFRSIYLSNNKFEAMSSYWFITNINDFDLSKNHIVGPIPFPKDLTISISFDRLYFNDNYFTGSIPESICHITSLEVLDLSNNQLSGRLPLCLGNLRGLVMLHLANNSLYGQIPSSLGNIEFINSLNLNENKLNGKLPQSMKYLIHLQYLDLGENELEGIIPSWIGQHLSELRVLVLQSNHFHGDIPTHLCQLSKLRILHLARNNFIGLIPSCFKNFSAMAVNYLDLEQLYFTENGNMVDHLLSFMGGRKLEYSSNIAVQLQSLDLSQNNINGTIPNELMNLVGLKNLNLSRNHLSGNIPEKTGNLRQLLSLDLSMNKLSGSIPPSLANLNFLNYLNLSFNELSGRIPTGNQLQTFVDSSIYAGNNGLCGKPLSNNCSDPISAQKKKPSFKHTEEKESILSWFYAGLGPGFAVGLLLIFCILLFKKSWRIAYFRFVENFSENTWEWCVLKTSKLRRKLQKML